MPLIPLQEFADMCEMGTNQLSVMVKRGKVVVQGDRVDPKHPTNKKFHEKAMVNSARRLAKGGDPFVPKHAGLKINPRNHPRPLKASASGLNVGGIESDAGLNGAKSKKTALNGKKAGGKVKKRVVGAKKAPAPAKRVISPKKQQKQALAPSKPPFIPKQPKDDPKPQESAVYSDAARNERLKAEIQEREIRKRDLDLEKKSGESIPFHLVGILFREYDIIITRAMQDYTEQIVEQFSAKWKIPAADRAEMRKMIVQKINKTKDSAKISLGRKVKSIIAEYSGTKGRGEREL